MSIPLATQKARFKLIKSRFNLSGAWRTENGALRLIAVTKGVESDVQLPQAAGIYLFVAKEVVQYVGKADNLHNRVGSYIRAAARAVRVAKGEYEFKKKPRPVQAFLMAALSEGEVKVFTLEIKRKRFTTGRSGLPLDQLVGLESGLIQNLKPKWNRSIPPD